MHCCPIKTLRLLHEKLNENGKVFLSTPAATLENGKGWGRKIKHYRTLFSFPTECKKDEIGDEHIYQYEENTNYRKAS